MVKNMIQIILIGLITSILIAQLIYLIKELIESKIERDKMYLHSILYRLDNNYSLNKKQRKVYKKYINNKNGGWDE